MDCSVLRHYPPQITMTQTMHVLKSTAETLKGYIFHDKEKKQTTTSNHSSTEKIFLTIMNFVDSDSGEDNIHNAACFSYYHFGAPCLVLHHIIALYMLGARYR